MSGQKLKTAVLGLNEQGQLLLRAASETDHFHVQAVADKDTVLAERIAEEYNCAAYDDYRQLIIQNQLDCLLVAAAMYSCDEHIRTAMRKKFNVLKLAPAARNFEEAAEFVRLAEDENVRFAIGNPSRFARSFLALREFLQEGKIEQIFLMTAFYDVGDQPHRKPKHDTARSESQPAWQTDPKLAGGGVLLHNCYEVIDQILWNFSMPQQVYSLHANQALDKQQRLYLTEDTAVVTMKFSDTLIGNLIASRRTGMGPRQNSLRLYGRDKILTVSDRRFTIVDGAGRSSEQLQCDDDILYRMTRLLENFALSILAPDENKLCSSGRENLKNMAVIESAYLSARTGFPEEPGRILQMASPRTGTPRNIWSVEK
jgi:predicted dehydrogenase